MNETTYCTATSQSKTNIQSCLTEEQRREIERFAESYELGLNRANQRLGVLFPPWLVDFRIQPPSPGDTDRQRLNDTRGQSNPGLKPIAAAPVRQAQHSYVEQSRVD